MPADFVIVSFPRCGTHMLRTALDGHPQIACHAEVFNPAHPAGRHRLTEPVEILDRVVRARGGERAVGFCAHYYRTGDPIETDFQAGFPRLWDGLPDLLLPDVRCILLTRANLLRRYVSFLAAEQTKQWTWMGPVAKRQPRPFRVDFDALRENVDRTRARMADAARLFPQTLPLTYEELCADFTAATARVQQFLGVDACLLQTATRKQGGRLRDVVVNYEELQRAAEGTSYEVFFDE